MTEDYFIRELRTRIRNMNYRTIIYKVLREELTKRGYWKNKAPRKAK